jgi:hypothetical protein
MRKIAGAISAVAFVSAAVLIFSKTVFVTQAVGMGVDAGIGEASAAAKIAYRFPANADLFREFIAPSSAAERAAMLNVRNVAAVPCSDLFSPHATTACLSANGKPAPAAKVAALAERPSVAPAERQAAAPIAQPRAEARPALVAAESRPAPVAAEPVRTRVAAVIPVAAVAPIATAAPVRAPAFVPPASCAQNLASANVRVERVLARIKDARTRQSGDACAAYRTDFFEVVQAREVTALCKTGADRERDLRRIDGAVEDINGAIAQTCGT